MIIVNNVSHLNNYYNKWATKYQMTSPYSVTINGLYSGHIENKSNISLNYKLETQQMEIDIKSWNLTAEKPECIVKERE